LSGLMSEVQKIAINDRRKDITEDDLVSAIGKGIKQRNDSIIQFTKGNRQDLVDIEEHELSIYKEFQPKQMSDDDVLALVDEVISETGATTKKQMGQVMGGLMKKIQKGTVDTKKLSALVMSKLD